jgi:hypothetical protein
LADAGKGESQVRKESKNKLRKRKWQAKELGRLITSQLDMTFIEPASLSFRSQPISPQLFSNCNRGQTKTNN